MLTIPEHIQIYLILLSILVFGVLCRMCYNNYVVYNKNLTKQYVLDNVKHDISNMKGLDLSNTKQTSDKIFKNLKNMYINLEKITTKYDIKLWAISGTVLGAYRHKGFIPWDDDMDFATDIKNKKIMKSSEFLRDLNNIGLNLTYNQLTLPIFRITNINAKNISPPFIDIFFTVEEDGKLKTCMRNNKMLTADNLDCNLFNPKMSWNKEWVYPITKVKFEDIEIWIPKNPEKIISQEFSKHALDSAVVSYGHAALGWLIPTTTVNKSSIQNKVETLNYWIDENPLNKGNIVKPNVLGVINPIIF